MGDYIKRKAALDICQKEYEDRIRMADYCGDTAAWNIGGAIKKIPAADVVEVVHCKDCIYYRNKECESDDFWSALYGDDIGLHYVPEPDFYCACGERRNKK